MGIDFPITGEALLTVLGSAAFSVLISMWLKHYLADWRYTNLFVLGIAELFAVTARLLVGMIGATLATFGYETVTNLLGLAGVGRRSDTAILAQAEVAVEVAAMQDSACECGEVGCDCCKD